MSNKKVTIGAKPTASKHAEADEWVNKRATVLADDQEPLKRLTLDIPQNLHSRIKSDCALKGKKMVDVITEMLLEKFPK